MPKNNKKGSARRGTVGFRKPPKYAQFPPGKSGNPKGRPKGSKNFATAIQQELNKSIVATEGGKVRKLKKRHAVATQLVNKAASGDIKATGMLLQEERQREGNQSSAQASDVFDRSEDLLVIASVVERIRKSHGPDNPVSASTKTAPKTKTLKPVLVRKKEKKP
jgi:hypothetical protein